MRRWRRLIPVDGVCWTSSPCQELGGKANTLQNRLAAIKEKNKAWCTSNKVTPNHVQMNSYSNFALRFRFVKGFSALGKLHGIWSRMGMEGLAHKKFPVPSTVLLGSAILTADAFTTNADRASVPAWRGATFSDKLCAVLETRFFDYVLPSGNSDRSVASLR